MEESVESGPTANRAIRSWLWLSLAPGKPSGTCQEHGWLLSHGRGGVERGGGLVPPHGRTKYTLSCDRATKMQPHSYYLLVVLINTT